VSKAAGELRVTASAVAQSIAVIEDRVQMQLVRSLLPVVELTEPGDRYFRSVQAFATQLRDGLFERFPVGRTQLRISASQALSRLWLAPRISEFVGLHPRIDLVLTTCWTEGSM
jgi:LysR family transcriptional regulator, glycine cleavage system transcriptional activator